jgi:ADP-heptose:LPS heptosyltransferase
MAHQGRKRWPQESYIDLCYRLKSAGITPVLVGSKSDRLNKLIEACNGFGGVNLIDKTTLFQLITLGAGAMACIGNDTGPQLIVAGARCPTVTLFSEANPPMLGGAWAWDQAKHFSVFKPNLAELDVDTVWDAFKRLTAS